MFNSRPGLVPLKTNWDSRASASVYQSQVPIVYRPFKAFWEVEPPTKVHEPALATNDQLSLYQLHAIREHVMQIDCCLYLKECLKA